jgi:WXG100 family type VII secretion target
MTESYVEMTGVNYGHVTNAAQALTDAYETIVMILQETQAAISPLQETWAGVSEQEYEGVQNRWLTDVQQLQDSLGGCIGTLNQMAINYSQDLTFPLPDNT